MSDYPRYPTDPSGAPAPGAPAPGRGPLPPSVDLAVKLLWGAIALGLLGAVLTFATGESMTSELTGSGLTAEQADAATGLAVALGALFVLVLTGAFVLLTVFIGKGANWARITTTVLTAIGLVLTLPSLFALGSAGSSVASSLISLVQIALCVVAVVLCFRPDANAWFKAR